MKSGSPFRSLQITPPFGGVLFNAVVLLCVLIFSGEAIIRLGVVNHWFAEPLLGTVNAELDIKIQMMDRITSEVPVNCIFLGSSQFDSAIDPAIFSDEVFLTTGKKLNCFNFSLGTLTAGPAGTVAKMLLNRYHPDVLIYGISARDFSRDFGELTRPLPTDPWMQQQLLKPNIAGWITENSLFFRWLNQIRAALNPEYLSYRNSLYSQLSADGHLSLEGNETSLDTDNFIPKYNLYPPDLSGLDEIISLRKKGLNVIILEIPVYPDFLPVYVESSSDQYFAKFRQPITDQIISNGIPFVYSLEEMESVLSESDWNDSKHLNKWGAADFSKWFADEFVPFSLMSP